MKEQWRIRKAVAGDSVGFQACMEAAYAPYKSRMGGKHLPSMDVDYSLEINNFPCWVAELNGTIAEGLIMMFKEEYASIANVAVHPEFQGQGWGPR